MERRLAHSPAAHRGHGAFCSALLAETNCFSRTNCEFVPPYPHSDLPLALRLQRQSLIRNPFSSAHGTMLEACNELQDNRKTELAPLVGRAKRSSGVGVSVPHMGRSTESDRVPLSFHSTRCHVLVKNDEAQVQVPFKALENDPKLSLMRAAARIYLYLLRS